MTTNFDLNAYLRRIGWSGGTAPTYATLAGILEAHMRAIPYENLDVLLGRPVRLDIESLQNKLVHAHRGGYCFEQVTLFATALESLGFEPVRHSARVLLYVPVHEAPRTHMFLTVSLPEGVFVLDPGLGGMAPRLPVPLTPDSHAINGNERHEMVPVGDRWMLRAHLGEKLVDVWISTLEQDHPIDFELANHYTATHPASPFAHRLMLRALTADGRITILNRTLTIRKSGQAQTLQIADRAHLRALLGEYFNFDLPEVEQLHITEIPEWE